jgi:glycosyltransferase involved in cell wall biosynthesis
MSDDWRYYLHEVREIWTGSDYNVECFRKAGFEGKIFKFPQPTETEVDYQPISILNTEKYDFIFYSIFQWIERKDPKTLLQAYWSEFEHDKNVCLFIKTHRMGFNETENRMIAEDVAKWKKEMKQNKFPRVVMCNELLSDEAMHRIHETGSCFISTHRGEGWGIPIADALVHGKPVISTGLGGVHEWIPDDCMFKVKYNMINVGGMDWAEQYREDQKWAQVDIQDLRHTMRHIYNHGEEARQVGLRGARQAKKMFNFKQVGKLMKQRIAEIYKEQGFK